MLEYNALYLTFMVQELLVEYRASAFFDTSATVLADLFFFLKSILGKDRIHGKV